MRSDCLTVAPAGSEVTAHVGRLAGLARALWTTLDGMTITDTKYVCPTEVSPDPKY